MNGPVEPGGKPAGRARIGRRELLGGALAAGSVAVAYAALGHPFGVLESSNDGVSTAPGEDAISSENVQISHLLRRAGFGMTRAEYDRYQSMGLSATLDEVLDFAAVDDSAAEELSAQIKIDATTRALPTVWWLVRMANTKRPLQEKMTLFWHGLLTSQISEVKDPQAMVVQNEFFRSHAMDRFPDILKGISKDPAMMTYLDIAGSNQRAPNENYARELMELFSLGVGNYTETDVREAARAFTGWAVPRERVNAGTFTLKEPVFRPQAHDNGRKTFLGETGNFGPDEIIDIITKQPASAAYIVRRLFSFFVYPDPTDAELAPFIEVYKTQDMRIGAVVEAMLRSEVFKSAKAYRGIVKSPVEYAIGAMKALDLQQNLGQVLGQQGQRGPNGGALASMGQVLFEPPNVAGWPGGASWLNSATIFARLNFLNSITSGSNATQRNNAGARRQAAATPTAPAGLGTAEDALAHFLPLTVDGVLPDDARQVLIDYAGGEETPLSAEKLRGLVYLVLGTPQFHLS